MRSIFTSARLKLTAWYLLIIMAISIIFSSVIYDGINNEFKEIERLQQIFESRQELGLPPIRIPRSIPIELLDPEVLAAARLRVVTRLVLLNIGIFFTAGFAGYFLAGRTLRPIQTMVDEQNRFITDASHELRTPLTALRSEMEVGLLNRKMSVKEAHELIQSNLEEVISLQALSDNLLELAQYEKTKTVIILNTISSLEVIEEAKKKVLPLAKKRNISIKVEMEDAKVRGHKEKLRELFIILLDNAIKYSPEQSNVTITSRNSSHYQEISIADQGIGIDKKDFPYIFDRFYRADASRTRSSAAGYGLGLSIAKKIVDLHNGTISIKSEVNKGTTILVQLPVTRKTA